MTGPEHYREAERLAVQAGESDLASDLERYTLAKAQVHATLALAAATALSSNGEMPVSDSDGWIDAASAYERPAKRNGGQS